MTTDRSQLKQMTNQDGTAVLDMRRGVITTLNPSGGYVWERLQRGIPVDQIVAELAKDTDTPVPVIEADVQRFLTALREQELVS